MTFQQLCFSFKGRINRATFWAYNVVAFWATLLFFFLLYALIDNPTDAIPFFVVCYIPAMFMNLAVCVKRLHDISSSGWHFLLILIPVLGFLFVLFMGLLPGTQGPNRYGEQPKAGILKGNKLMIDNTVKLTIKNLGENVIERAVQLPDQSQDYLSLIQQWSAIKGYINGRISVIDEIVEDIERKESNQIPQKEY